MFKIDIFLPQEQGGERRQLTRRISHRVGSESNERVWILSAEDVIRARLEWFRPGGESSQRQWRDVLGVIKAQEPTLDMDYLREWAGRLQVSDLLKRAVADATVDRP